MLTAYCRTYWGPTRDEQTCEGGEENFKMHKLPMCWWNYYFGMRKGGYKGIFLKGVHDAFIILRLWWILFSEVILPYLICLDYNLFLWLTWLRVPIWMSGLFILELYCLASSLYNRLVFISHYMYTHVCFYYQIKGCCYNIFNQHICTWLCV